MPLNPLYEKADRWAAENKWNADRIAKWESTRAKGIGRWLLLFVASFTAMGVAVVIVLWFFAGRDNPPWFIWCIPIVVSALGGLQTGGSIWRNNQQQFKIAVQLHQPQIAQTS
jgi:hypothetical protein